MYLRRFKASPNASPIKQEEHRRRARARRIVTKPTVGTVSSIRRMTSSDSDSSGTRIRLAKLKQKPQSTSQQHDSIELNGMYDADQQDQDVHQHAGHDLEHHELRHDHRGSSHKADNGSQEQDDDEEEAYRRAGLQKPRKLGEGDNPCLQHCTN